MALLLLASAACQKPSDAPGAEQPKVEIYVLVDLSLTWLNDRSKAHNRDVLSEVGEGIASYATNVEGPVSIQHREIGQASLMSAPLCAVFFKQSLLNSRNKGAGRIGHPKQLRRYLSDHCPERILAHPPEPRTEISSALASVAAEPRPPAGQRYIIIASDFLEDTPADAPLRADALKGDHVLMLYRPVAEDQMDPRQLALRIGSWRQVFESRGATVSEAPDPNVQRNNISAFLNTSS